MWAFQYSILSGEGYDEKGGGEAVWLGGGGEWFCLKILWTQIRETHREPGGGGVCDASFIEKGEKQERIVNIFIVLLKFIIPGQGVFG